MIKSNVYENEEIPEHTQKQEYKNVDNIDIDMGNSR